MPDLDPIFSRLIDLMVELDERDADITYTLFPEGIPMEYDIPDDEARRIGRDIVELHGFEHTYFYPVLMQLIECILDLAKIAKGTDERERLHNLLFDCTMSTPKELEAKRSELLRAFRATTPTEGV